ncbi:MAG: amidohydrolase, partial [Pseudonocardia sp.]
MPSTVFANAVVHALDRAGTVASALAVTGGRVVAVGDLSTCRERAGAGAEEFDLGGAAVLPGLT